LVAITREGLRLRRIPGAGGDRLLQLGQPGQMALHRLAAFRGEPEPRARPPADRALATDVDEAFLVPLLAAIGFRRRPERWNRSEVSNRMKYRPVRP
jgi:hypothetical protein